MKRTILVLVALVSAIMTGCLPSGSSKYSYESDYLYMPYVFLLDTTYINEKYDGEKGKDAKFFVDTTAGRYFLNRDLFFTKHFSVEGESFVDADTQMFNKLVEPVLEVLPEVKGLDYAEVFAGVDSVFAGEVMVTYQVRNLTTGADVLRDTITNYEIVKVD